MWTFSVAMVTDMTAQPALKVLPDKRVIKMFIVYPHGRKYFFVIFLRFKRIITIKKPFLATLIDENMSLEYCIQ